MPNHGYLNCSCCWSCQPNLIQEAGPFRLVRDPGHWGAADPRTLVLGISKGNTQAKAIGNELFEKIAFKGMRHRILQVFQSVGLLPHETAEKFERRFEETESEYAFASVVRCSITGMDRNRQVHTADSPNVLPAFKRGSPGRKFVENCVDQFLKATTSKTNLVLLLGNTDSYMKSLSEVIADRRGSFARINPVAYTSRGLLFVHLAHPSPGNGHFGSFVRGEGKPGAKRDLAKEALAHFA